MLSVEGNIWEKNPKEWDGFFDALRQLHVCRIHRQTSNLAPEKRERD